MMAPQQITDGTAISFLLRVIPLRQKQNGNHENQVGQGHASTEAVGDVDRKKAEASSEEVPTS